MKHLKHASKTLAKTPEKHLKPLQKHTQPPDKNTCNICVKRMQHPVKHTCNNMSENTNETLGIDFCKIHVQLLQHMQHSDLLLQLPFKTLAAYL